MMFFFFSSISLFSLLHGCCGGDGWVELVDDFGFIVLGGCVQGSRGFRLLLCVVVDKGRTHSLLLLCMKIV